MISSSELNLLFRARSASSIELPRQARRKASEQASEQAAPDVERRPAGCRRAGGWLKRREVCCGGLVGEEGYGWRAIGHVSPNSFSMMAIFLPCVALRMWLSSVVFPAPKKPVRMVTGTRPSSFGSTSIGAMGAVSGNASARGWARRVNLGQPRGRNNVRVSSEQSEMHKQSKA